MINCFEAVYYIDPGHLKDWKNLYNPIAIRPTFYSYDNGTYIERRCEWQDTVHGASFFFDKIIEDNLNSSKKPFPHKFSLIGKDNQEVVFTYLTNQLFKEKLADQTWGNPTFSNDEELQSYYLKLVNFF